MVGGFLGGLGAAFYMLVIGIMEIVEMVQGKVDVTFGTVAYTVFMFMFREFVAGVIILVAWIGGMACFAGAGLRK